MPTSFETDLGVDAPDTAASALVLAIGGWTHGAISTALDGDFIAVELVAGQTYSFAMVGINSANLTDPYLQLFAPDGTTPLAANDNALVNGNAALTFTAAQTGTFFLRASGAAGALGDYAVCASIGDKANFDGMMIAGILDSHLSWSGTRGTAAALTFGFADTDVYGLTGFSQFTEAQKDAMRAVLAQFAEVAGLAFTEVSPGGYTDNATLLYGNYNDAADGAAAWGGLPGDTLAGSIAGDVWINTVAPPGTAPLPGSLDFQIMLHEIGHTMGLTHPGIYIAGPELPVSYATHADFVQDSTQYTVMSYFGPGFTGASTLYADTLGIHDIAALQLIYGANAMTRVGNDTYGFGSTAGQVYDFDWNFDPKLTIWDGGGIDTLNTSQYSADQIIRLTAGALSDIGGYLGNVGIAFGSVIENAVGGRGADQIGGNDAENHLQGGQGDDVVDGAAGDDSLQGGVGGDTLRGGAGNDTLVGDDTTVGVAAPQVFNLVTTNGPANSIAASNVYLFDPNFTLELVWQQLSAPVNGIAMEFGNLGIQVQADFQSSLYFAGAAEENWLYNIIPSSLMDGDPHRLSITYDDGDGTLIVYIDGVRTAEHRFTPGTRYLTSSGGDISFSGNAAVGDVRIFTSVLSAQDIWDRSWITLPDPANTPSLLNNWVGTGNGTLTNSLSASASFAAIGAPGNLAVTLQDQTIGNLMEGGGGDDDYVVRSALDQVVEAAGAGTDHVTAHVNFTLGAGQHVERLTIATGYNGIHLAGNERANLLTSAIDAADTLAGGAGDDVYYLHHAGDQVIEGTGGGNDAIHAFANHTLASAAQVEEIRALGSQGLTLIGNGFANRFFSNAAFADTLSGGAGDDSYTLYRSDDQVIEAAGDGTDVIYAYVNFSLAATAQVETLRAQGNAGRSLTGNALANVFHSNAAYADTLSGGGGNDVYYVKHAGDRVNEAPGAGTDVIYASANHSLASGSYVEHIWAQGSTGLSLVGNSLANSLYGNAAFADTLSGGGGNDVYYVKHASDRVIEALNGGTDAIYASANHMLAAGSYVEQVWSAGSKGLTLTGNSLSNAFFSNAGYADIFVGGAGNDSYTLRHLGDRVIEGASGGTDAITSYVHHTLASTSAVEYLRAAGTTGLRLTGNALSNRIYGGTKADTIEGGAGQDYLFGGSDRVVDRFVFRAATDSKASTLRDTVSGFVQGIDDIDISLIDANTTIAGNQAFAFGGTAPLAFGVWQVRSGTALIIRADVNGDTRPDMEIALLATSGALRGDFIF